MEMLNSDMIENHHIGNVTVLFNSFLLHRQYTFADGIDLIGIILFCFAFCIFRVYALSLNLYVKTQM